ncbi:MAG: hypothetical protein JWP97_496 [Labilithrix sp.]|nr:hypothetical protein [Labilithrix sp.]
MNLRLSTWNCFGMGQGASAITHLRAPYPERLRDPAVLRECAAADVLCIQELLSRDAQLFFDGIGEPGAGAPISSRFRDHNRPHFGTGTVRGSGLGVTSRFPFTKTLVRTFPGRRAGWDRLARKGILYAQLDVNGVLVDLVTAHLQAGYDRACVEARQAQLADLGAFVEACSDDERPFIVCGDLNIDGLAHQRGAQEYATLATTLGGFEDLGAAADLPTFDPEGNLLSRLFEPGSPAQRIDYIWWRPARRGAQMRCTGAARFFDRPLDATRLRGQPGWPSDHYGLCATFEIGSPGREDA